MIAPRIVPTFALVALMAALPLTATATEPAYSSPPPEQTTVQDCYDEETGQFVSCERYHYDCVNERGEMVSCDQPQGCVQRKEAYSGPDGQTYYRYWEECRYEHECSYRTYPQPAQPAEEWKDYDGDGVRDDGEVQSSPPTTSSGSTESAPPTTSSAASEPEPASSGTMEPAPTSPSPGDGWYDANGNGQVDEGERGETVTYSCAEPTPVPPCDRHHMEMEARGRAIQERQDQERLHLDEAWKGRYQEFSQSPHTDEEWKAFHAQHDAAVRDLNARHAAEWDEFRYASANTACAQPTPVQPACAIEYREREAYVYDEKVRLEMERLHRLLEERRLEFEAGLRAEYDAFMRSGPSDEEAARFKQNTHDRMVAFEVEQQSHLLEWKQRMAEAYGQYAAHAGWACSGVVVDEQAPKPLPATAPAHVRKHHSKYADWERQRLAFELELRILYADFLDGQAAALREFLAGNPSDADRRAFEARQEADRLAFELDMRDRMRGFELRLKAEWKSAVGDDLDAAPKEERFGSFSVAFDEELRRILVTGKYVAFQGDPETQAIGPHTVQGQLILDGLYASELLEEFDFNDGQGGSRLDIQGERIRMSLHDHPSGLVKVKTKDGAAVHLDFADYLDVQPHGNGFRLSADGVEAILRIAGEGAHEAATNTVSLSGEATFLLTNAPAPVLDQVTGKHRKAVHEAIEKGQVAAEVTLVKGGEAVAEQRLEYGAVEVTVEATDLKAKSASLHIESAEHDGKTIVVNLDRDGFGRGVDLAFYELDGDGGESPAPIVKASSLADVLDASDDDSAEYWVVVDEDGTQVLVSIPHFSAKRLEIQGSATSAAPNVVLVGGLIGLGVIAVALVVWRATSRLPGEKK